MGLVQVSAVRVISASVDYKRRLILTIRNGDRGDYTYYTTVSTIESIGTSGADRLDLGLRIKKTVQSNKAPRKKK